jgi:DNA-cytosine methyltransferase
VPPVTIRKDIRLLDIESIHNALKDRGIAKGDLDCMIGGPPCQGFSQLRRNEHREKGQIVKFGGYSQLSHDPRNDLVLRYLEIAEALRPKFLVIENVPQMLNHGFEGRLGKLAEIVVQMLEKDLGYKVEVAVVNCADYGVPQLRERAIFIASTIGSVSFPKASHANPSIQHTGLEPWITVADAINDLPEPTLKEEHGGGSLNLYGKFPSEYALSMRTSDSFPYNHITRTYKDSVINILKEMRPGQTWDAESARMRSIYDLAISRHSKIRNIPPELAREELEKLGTINTSFYHDYYWSAYTRLAWNAPALTITANANFLGSGRFSHPEKLRGITMREAARLQSFDDDFLFITSMSDDYDTTHIGIGMDMIGEAVPPNLARAIALHLAAQLDARYSNENSHKAKED